ncbi:MAG: PAS domain S-box protein [bacterium]
MEVEAYAGAPLFDSTGKVLGLLVVLCRQPLEHPEVAESLLKIFAVRASAELERNQTEKTIRESEKRFRDLFEGSPDAIFVEDLEGNVLDANPAAGKLQGIDHKELFGKNIIDLVPPDQSEIAEKEFHKLVKGEIKHIEGLSRSQKGQDIPIEIHASHISYAGKPALLLLVRDISERKKAEREKQQMEAQLRQAQKLETIGRLAGGVAHDINNILTPILCYTDMAMHQLPANSESHNDLEQVIQGANRAKELVQQILLFSRQAEQERKPVRLQLIVHEALKFLRATLPATIEIRENLDDDCQAVLADPSQMHQVVMNLCTNAYDAMRENGGCMEISLEAVYVDTGLKRKLPNLQTGRYVRLTVKDNGQGIQSNALEHIFEPFYTTKPVRRGTGLGLSVVHGIVMSHGGEIEVCSEPGTGASFRIYLPAIAAPDLPPIREVHVPVGGKERILFVDDEKEIVKIGKRMLEAFGYRVTTCSNGSEALQVFRAQPRHFDLIISDQTMPELTGLKLATEIKRIRADMPIILTTGYSEEATPELLDKIGVQTCVMKPFKADDIARAIRQALHPQNHPTKK